MSEQSVLILCASCKVQPVPEDPGSQDRWRCPQCGQQDCREAVLEDGKAHAAEMAQRGWNDGIGKVAGKSRFMTFKPGRIEPRSYRWISDFSFEF